MLPVDFTRQSYHDSEWATRCLEQAELTQDHLSKVDEVELGHDFAAFGLPMTVNLP
jgi:hypothetical protein